MKLYEITYPDDENNPITDIFTEEEILSSYWEYWKGRMVAVGKSHLICPERCIEDWATLHWASTIEIPI